ncbi:MAG: hypothetical protein ABI583_07080 [Betaproteobacteria bacterium]
MVYLAIVIAAPKVAMRTARATNATPLMVKLAGIGGFLLVTLPLFWDWVPTVMAHSAYCKKDAGVFVYKTVEQWKNENPGVAEGLTESDAKTIPIENGRRHLLNQRIAWDIRDIKQSWGNWQREEAVVDLKDGAVLALYRNYSTAVNGSLVGGTGGGLRDWKLWMSHRTCEADEQKEPGLNKFSNLMGAFSRLGFKQ